MVKISVKSIDPKQLYPLREAWLVATGVIPEARIVEDKSSRVEHLGAFCKGSIVGVVSLYNEPRPGMVERKAWRLRGLASDPSRRGEGIGCALLEAATRRVTRSRGDLLWGNVPVDTSDFFRKMKFEPAGDPFETRDGGLQQRVLFRPKKR